MKKSLLLSSGGVLPLLLALSAPSAVQAGVLSGTSVGGAASLDSEVIDNFDGGLSDDAGGNTLGFASLWADLQGGGRLQASVTAFYGNQPGGRYVGDFQGVSNIEAPRRDRLFELWYRQPLGGHWDVQLGLIPADDYFGVTDSAGLLLNGSFGAPGTWGDNVDAPIYPTAGVGAMAYWHAGPWSNRAGVFQTDPHDRSSALHAGALVMDEIAYDGNAAGIYKLGVWNYRPHAPASRGLAPQSRGGWVSAEHGLGKATTGFLRVGGSPNRGSLARDEVQAGILAPSPMASRPDDRISLGLTRADLRATGAETTWEAAWLLSFGDNVSLQPDLQYVRHPSGNLDSAVVGILRLHIGLE